MKIQLKKKGQRNELLCVRNDGSLNVAGTNEGTALHDLAHYVVEKELQLTKAFYGSINTVTVWPSFPPKK